MPEIGISADELASRLLGLSGSRQVCILDSCGVGHLGSHLLIAGVDPVETQEFSQDPQHALEGLANATAGELPCFFTLSYALGLALANIPSQHADPSEPFVFLATYENLVVYDYAYGRATVVGRNADALAREILGSQAAEPKPKTGRSSLVSTSFSMREYLDAVEAVREEIRSGNTYQANIVQRFEVELGGMEPQAVFRRLRRDHPAPFAAFIQRQGSTVVSASPERFFHIEGRSIEASPIKGTAPRTGIEAIDRETRIRLAQSRKDLAENTMIVDLLRNDLGRVCEFGSVEVAKLCELEQHPTLYHLVSTIKGRLLDDAGLTTVIKALFPCGSITGAPKISTMKIIDRIEQAPRGLAMGAIGYCIPPGFETGNSGLSAGVDTNVAIRTMVIRNDIASFSAGGGIVNDSEPALEYQEMLLKAKALLAALELDHEHIL